LRGAPPWYYNMPARDRIVLLDQPVKCEVFQAREVKADG
jgi:hypothetical protein